MAEDKKLAEVKAPEYSEAQLFKQKQIKEKKDAEDKKLADTSKKVTEQAKAYESGSDILGSWIPYKDASGIESPSMVVGVSLKGEGRELKALVSVLVYSAKTAAPYRAQVEY